MNNKQNISIRESLRKLRLVEFVYPSVIVLFLGITMIIFFFTTQYISKKINEIFANDNRDVVQSLNLEHYNLVTKKLNIKTTGSQKEVPVSEKGVVSEMEKQEITITVKNSTAKSGVATLLAKTLEDAGFQKPKIGNETTYYATTTVYIKEGLGKHQLLLLDTIQKTYPDVISTTSPKMNTTDVTIIIGTN